MSINATDLLDESGNVDPSKVRSHQNTLHADVVVTGKRCGRIRRAALHTHDNAPQLGESFDLAASTIREHLKGECECVTDAPTCRYRHTSPREWVIDE